MLERRLPDYSGFAGRRADDSHASTKHSVQLQQKLTQLLGAGTVRVQMIEAPA